MNLRARHSLQRVARYRCWWWWQKQLLPLLQLFFWLIWRNLFKRKRRWVDDSLLYTLECYTYVTRMHCTAFAHRQDLGAIRGFLKYCKNGNGREKSFALSVVFVSLEILRWFATLLHRGWANNCSDRQYISWLRYLNSSGGDLPLLPANNRATTIYCLLLCADSAAAAALSAMITAVVVVEREAAVEVEVLWAQHSFGAFSAAGVHSGYRLRELSFHLTMVAFGPVDRFAPFSGSR